jgi:hypothetical protein
VDHRFGSPRWRQAIQGFRDRVIRHSGTKNPTVRDFINVSGRDTVKEHTILRQPRTDS